MAGIPDHLYPFLLRALLRSTVFESNATLRAVFVQESLAQWRDAIPETNSLRARAQALIFFLLDQYNDAKECALLLFLRVLESDASHRGLYRDDYVRLIEDLTPILQYSPDRAARPVLDLHTREDALMVYLANLEAYLDEDVPFVNLAGEAAITLSDYELLQTLEWSTRLPTTDKIIHERLQLHDAYQRFHRFVLLGEPGTGKTTYLKHLTLTLVEAYRQRENHLIPVFISAADWQEREMPAFDFVRDALSKLAGAQSYLVEAFEGLLLSGDLVILLDGLNEIPGRELTYRQKAAGMYVKDPRERSLEELATRRAVRTRFVVSCRTHEFGGAPDWQSLRILPMDQETVTTFVNAYTPDAQVDHFLEVLEQNAPLYELAKIPFFLRYMTQLPAEKLVTIKSRGQFLDFLVHTLIRREQPQNASPDVHHALHSISRLAFRMIADNQIGSSAPFGREGLAQARDLNLMLGTGLIARIDDGHFRFYHQIIQEYFAALALREGYVKRNVQRMLCHTKWIEVLALWHHLDPEQSLYPTLIDALQQRNRFGILPLYYRKRALWTGSLCTNLITFLWAHYVMDRVFGSSSMWAFVQQHSGLVLGSVALGIVGHFVLLRLTYQGDVILNAAKVLSRLADMPGAVAPLIQAFARVGEDKGQREVLAQALASYGEESLPLLAESMDDPSLAVQLGCIETLGRIASLEAARILGDKVEGALKNHTALVVPIVLALAKIESPHAASALLVALCAPEFRTFIPQQNSNYLNDLENNLKDILSQVPALDEDIQQKYYKALVALTHKDQPSWCRKLAISCLGFYSETEGLSVLLRIAEDQAEDEDLREAAEWSLSLQTVRRADEATVMEVLSRTLKGGKAKTRYAIEARVIRLMNATRYLELVWERWPGQGEQLSSVEGFKVALACDDATVRYMAIVGITMQHFTGDSPLLPLLLTAQNDESIQVRTLLAATLRNFEGEEAETALRRMIHDPDAQVRIAALDSLDYASPEAACVLLQTLAMAPAYPERQHAIRLLGSHRHTDVRETLQRLTLDADMDIRAQALDALYAVDRGLAKRLRRRALPWHYRCFTRARRTLVRAPTPEPLKPVSMRDRMIDIFLLSVLDMLPRKLHFLSHYRAWVRIMALFFALDPHDEVDQDYLLAYQTTFSRIRKIVQAMRFIVVNLLLGVGAALLLRFLGGIVDLAWRYRWGMVVLLILTFLSYLFKIRLTRRFAVILLAALRLITPLWMFLFTIGLGLRVRWILVVLSLLIGAALVLLRMLWQTNWSRTR